VADESVQRHVEAMVIAGEPVAEEQHIVPRQEL
jgi:hypothetical protein